jgi:hypothetical protein
VPLRSSPAVPHSPVKQEEEEEGARQEGPLFLPSSQSTRQEGEGEGLRQEEPLFLPSSQLTQQEIELIKHEAENMAEILQFDDDDLEEFAVSDRKSEDTEMEDVSEIAATQSDHSSGKVSQFFGGSVPLLNVRQAFRPLFED